MANIVTGCRILLSAIMLFSQVFSQVFYICYLFAGITDMIDGSIARKLGTAGSSGAKFDSAADLVLVSVTAVKILPVIDISMGIVIWICIIALLKITNIFSGFVRYKQFAAVHSIANKLSGALLFAFPFTIKIIPLEYSTFLLCTAATIAAIQEGYIIRTEYEYGH